MEFKTIVPLADGRLLCITMLGRMFIAEMNDASREIVLHKYTVVAAGE